MTIIAISKHGYEDANCSQQFTTRSILPKIKVRENKDNMLSPIVYGYKQGTINSSDTYDIRTLNQRRGFGNRAMYSNNPDKVYKQKTLSCIELNTSRSEYGSLRSTMIEKQGVVEVEKKINEDMENKIVKEKQVYNEVGKIYGNPRPRVEKIKVFEGDKRELSDKLIPSRENYGDTPEEIAEGLGYDTPDLDTITKLQDRIRKRGEAREDELRIDYQEEKQYLLKQIPLENKEVRLIVDKSETQPQANFLLEKIGYSSWGEALFGSVLSFMPSQRDFEKMVEVEEGIERLKYQQPAIEYSDKEEDGENDNILQLTDETTKPQNEEEGKDEKDGKDEKEETVYYRNPETNRKIKKGGRPYNNFMKRGIVLELWVDSDNNKQKNKKKKKGKKRIKNFTY